jgi:hypothetical protein
VVERPCAQHPLFFGLLSRTRNLARMSRVAAASDGVRYAAQSLGRTPTCTRRSSICVPVGPTTRAAASPRTLGWRRRRGALVSRRVTTGEDTETEVTKDNSEQTRLGERVVGVAGGMVIPQKIIDAERAANPLRRPRLLVYCLAACVAAAQVRLGDNGGVWVFAIAP